MNDPAPSLPLLVPIDERDARRAKNRRLGRIALLRSGIFCAFIIATVLAVTAGLHLRRWTWEQTRWVHYFGDINNAYYWGSQASQPANGPRGFLNVYDFAAGQAHGSDSDSPEYQLDYAPLRLYIMTRWVGWAERQFPDLAAKAQRASADRSKPRAWDTQYDFFAPLLEFNTGMEVLTCAGLFLLTRHWAIRRERFEAISAKAQANLEAVMADRSLAPSRHWIVTLLESPAPFRGWLAGYAAAMLFWFNPAVLLSAHGYPTWDIWVMPFFVWAVYLASIDFWLLAGFSIAIGAMFKGQEFFVAPMFVLWPIFLGRPMQALRWLIGLAMGISLIALPWLVTFVPSGVSIATVAADRVLDRPAVAWIAGIVIAAFILPQLLRARRDSNSTPTVLRLALWSLLPITAVVLCLWPFLRVDNHEYAAIGFLLAAVVLTAGQFLPFKLRALFAGGAVAAALLLCPLLFHGSPNWAKIGWGYGTRHYYSMTIGYCDNLAGVLHEHFGWNDLNEPAFTIDAHAFNSPMIFTIRQVLIGAYAMTLLLSVIGMTLQYRRNDPRFLIAIVAPWLMFFAFLPQMQERYLLYAAGIGCCMTGVSIGATLLELFLAAVAWSMPMLVMLKAAMRNGYIHDFGNAISPTFKTSLFHFLRGTYPDAGWAVILCAAIFLYLAFTPSPGSKVNEEVSVSR